LTCFTPKEVLTLKMLLNMTEGKPIKLILPFMVPLLIGNIFQQLYNIADIIIVGRTIGVQALASVGSIAPVFMMGVGLTIGLSNGFTVVTGQRYGAKDMAGVRKSIATCTYLSIIFVLITMALMHFGIDWLLGIMNLPQEIYADAKSYVMIITDGLVAMMGYNLLSGIMRSLGDSKTPLYCLIIASIINIALALAFIIYFGWGVPGSAVALVISQAISAILCIIYIYYRFDELHIGAKDFDFGWEEIWTHLRMGLPMAVQFTILGSGILILQSFCNKYGANTIAGFTTAVRVEQVALMPMISFGLSMAVYTAQNFGARRFDRIREGVRTCSKIALAFALCAMVLFFCFADKIVVIFLDNPSAEVVEASRMYIFYTVPVYFFLSQIFVFRNACQGMGVSLVPMLASTVELIMRCFAAFYLSSIWGYKGICLASPISWICCCIFVFGCYRYFIKVLESKNKIVP